MATCPPQLTSDTESATKDSQAGQPIKRSARVSMRAPEISHDQPPTRMMNRRNEAPGGTRRRSTISPMPPPSAPPVSASYVLTIPGCSPCDAGTEANSVSLASGVTTLMRLFGIPSAPSATPCSASARDLDSPKTASMSSPFRPCPAAKLLTGSPACAAFAHAGVTWRAQRAHLADGHGRQTVHAVSAGRIEYRFLGRKLAAKATRC